MISFPKNAFRILLATLAFTIWSPITFAHPGHGDPKLDATVMHYVLSPMHLLPILLVAAIAGGMMIYFRGAFRKDARVNGPAK